MRAGDDCSHGCVTSEGLAGRWTVGLERRRGTEPGAREGVRSGGGVGSEGRRDPGSPRGPPDWVWLSHGSSRVLRTCHSSPPYADPPPGMPLSPHFYSWLRRGGSPGGTHAPGRLSLLFQGSFLPRLSLHCMPFFLRSLGRNKILFGPWSKTFKPHRTQSSFELTHTCPGSQGCHGNR